MSGPFEAAVHGAVEAALGRWRASLPGTVAVHAVAIGWTTVEMGRTEASLLESAANAIGPFEDALGDALIGAHVRIAPLGLTAVPTVRKLALLEPSSEGRLTASLARLGEGPAVVWLAAEASTWSTHGAVASALGAGPFGPERLLLDGERDGRLVLVTDAGPGTIAT